jgi:O-antigen/teichoic acid export membrane protein
MISDELGLADNGVYSVAFQVGLIVGLVQNSFNQAWVPWFFQQCKDITHQIRLRIVRITYLYYLGLAIFTLLLYFATPFIYEVLGKEFRAGSELVGWIALGFLFNGMYKMQVNYLFYLERTLMIGVITVVTAAINIVLNWFLIKDYGIKGAAIATCITFLIQLIWVWVFSQRAFPMPWLKGLKKGE